MKTKVAEQNPGNIALKIEALDTRENLRLNQEFSSGLREFSEKPRNSRARHAVIDFGSATNFEVRHPLITFIDDLTGALKMCSDRYIRPATAIGIRQEAREDIDLSELLSALEAGEKRFDLLSHSKPSLDTLASASRHVANEAEFMVRGLRRNLITSSSDPAHPGAQKAASIFEAVDSLSHRLNEMKLSFEDLATGLFLQLRMQGNDAM